MSLLHKKLTALAASAGAIAAGGVAEADLIDFTPDGLSPGDTYYTVFVTDGKTTSTSSDPAVYDSLVATEAANAGIDTYGGGAVTWQTFASFLNGTDAITRFNPSAPIYTLDGDLVANSGADLWDGSIANPLNVTPTLDEVINDFTQELVWTGSNADGTVNKGLGNTNPIDYGLASATNTSWFSNGTTPNNSELRLYAFSSELTAVPEPSTVGLLAGGFAALAGCLRGRRKNDA